ncbi:MAG: 50S ribosomal protein L3 [Candidatus Pacebacteria bacterium]|nr:50S ribosomal protein L3 [Candidatus Paceibacterota bacterium]
MKCILGKKIGMAQVFDKEGKVIPVTLVMTDENSVLQVKTKEKDGYEAVKIGFEKLPQRKIKKTRSAFRFVKEFRTADGAYKIGDIINNSVFEEGDVVKISGVSKGKGFQGGVKRWGFSGKLSSSHGNKHEHRTIGSVGCATPARVIKGKRLPGRMGSERITVKNLVVVKVDKKNKTIALKGAVPGRRGTLLEISSQK